MSFVPFGVVLRQRISIKIDYVYLKTTYLQSSKYMAASIYLYGDYKYSLPDIQLFHHHRG